ncbi:MAG: T9SS type A sorting domain-containing protein [Bacteroidia bacterium]
MQKSILLLTMLANVMLINVGYAQTIPNADFETWSGGSPTGWTALTNIPALSVYTVTQSADHFSGSSSVKFNTVNYAGHIYPALMTNTNGIATSLKPVYLNGYIKSYLTGSDTFWLAVTFYSNTSGNSGGAVDRSNLNQTSWTPFHVSLAYPANFIPDTVLFYFQLHAATTSSVYIDSISFSDTPLGNELGAVLPGVKNISPVPVFNSFVYPDPANGNSHINFGLNSTSSVNIRIYDITGRFVKTVLNETVASGIHQADFNADELHSGIYFYTISGNGISETKKFVVNK